MRPGSATPARAALLATGLAAAGLLLLAGASASYAGVRQTAVTVTGTADNKFDPADIEASLDAKGNVTLTFKAAGSPHTLQSDQLKALNSGNVNAGESKKLTFAAKAGKYDVYCAYHKTLGMVGTLTVTAAGKAGGTPSASASASASVAASEAPPASASASASVGAPQPGVGAPTGEASGELPPGIEGNETLKKLDTERAAVHGAVSGFRFFTLVAVAFMIILGAAVLFSTRPRRAGR
jgi:plastocyanin